jgi:hypothetical protein
VNRVPIRGKVGFSRNVGSISCSGNGGHETIDSDFIRLLLCHATRITNPSTSQPIIQQLQDFLKTTLITNPEPTHTQTNRALCLPLHPVQACSFVSLEGSPRNSTPGDCGAARTLEFPRFVLPDFVLPDFVLPDFVLPNNVVYKRLENASQNTMKTIRPASRFRWEVPDVLLPQVVWFCMARHTGKA